MIPKLLSEDNPRRISPNDVPWIVSLLYLGAAIGAFVCIFLVNILGRKICILLTFLPASISWTLLIFSSSVVELYIARLIGGIAYGIISTAGPMYLSEVVTPQVRGALNSCFIFAISCGDLMGYVVGTYASTVEYASIAIGLCIIQVAAFVWFPETPYYLLSRKRYVASMDSLIFLRGTSDVTEEMNSIVRSVESDTRITGICSASSNLISSPGIIHQLGSGKRVAAIGVGIMMVQSFSGTTVIFCYAQTIFDAVNNVYLKGTYLSFILLIIYMVSSLICIGRIDNWGRRPLLIGSTIGVSACTFFLGAYFYVQKNAYDVDGLSWFAIGIAFLYMVTHAIGLSSVPIVVLNEIFPMHVKDVCVGLCFCLRFLLMFTLANVWMVIAFRVNKYVAFWLITFLNVLGIFFVVSYVPETKRKNLEEIRNSFASLNNT
ncbi:hypothetical protein KM043_016671 [Ampulex compressa]|nr:hypothetical protein KM043_016671 [Ampulex compressa]